MFSAAYTVNLRADSRHRFVKIRTRNRDYRVVRQTLFYTELIPLLKQYSLYMFTSSQASPFHFYVYLKTRGWRLYFLTTRYSLFCPSTFMVDGCGVYNTAKYFSFLTFSNFITNMRYSLAYRLDTPSNVAIPSASSFWNSSEWVEREMRELDLGYFAGLLDSRRLLFDYLYNFREEDFKLSYSTIQYDSLYQSIL